MGKKVIVLGGGIGGLTAAHELVERGFEVEVLEANAIPGGKSRSLPVPDSGLKGREPLPGEHGFRFIPGFYKHLPDSMERIPYAGNRRGCFDNLVDTDWVQIAPFGRRPVLVPSDFPNTAGEWRTVFDELFRNGLGLEEGETSFFAEKLWQVMTSCKERRLAELERMSWWSFVGAEHRSQAYQKFLAGGLSRSLVAAQPHEASARTIGQVQVHLASNIIWPGVASDRVLNGPTNKVLIDPWIAYLKRRGVKYHLKTMVKRILCEDGRISAIEVARFRDEERRHWRYEGDWFVSALPVEAMAQLLCDEMLAIDPGLLLIRELAHSVRWMNGIQFFLREDVPIVRGHILFVDSPWAITAISQPQFWRGVDLSQHGDGEVRGIISVDISDWGTPGLVVPKPAREVTDREDIKREVWEELKLGLNVGGKIVLRDEMLHSWFLDPDVIFTDYGRPRADINLEPLFINRPDSWRLRPPAVTGIPNFFLAADYVQTNTDLACMEAANEAARRAVNGLLEAAGSSARPSRIFGMEMPEGFAAWRAVDLRRFERGMPWSGKLR